MEGLAFLQLLQQGLRPRAPGVFSGLYTYTLGRASVPLTFSRRAGTAEHLLFRLSIYTARRSHSARHMLRNEVSSVVFPRNFHSSSRWRQKGERCCAQPCWSHEHCCISVHTLHAPIFSKLNSCPEHVLSLFEGHMSERELSA